MIPLQIAFALYGAAVGVFYPFLAILLESRGFGPVLIGQVVAAAAVAHAIAVPVWTHLADGSLGHVRAIQVAAVTSGFLLAAFGLDWAIPVLAVLVVLLPVAEGGISPILDVLAVGSIPEPARSYAKVRVASSAAFAAATLLAGLLYDHVGFWPATLLWGVLCLAIATTGRALVGGVSVPARHTLVAGAGTVRPSGNPLHAWRHLAARMGGVLVAIFFVNVGLNAAFTFVGLLIVELGGRPSDVAAAGSLGAIVEIPAWLAIGVVLPRLGVRVVFVGGAIGLGLVVGAWGLIESTWLIVASRALAGMAFASLWVASIIAVRNLVPSDRQATGQGLFQLTAFGLAALAANSLGGLIYVVSPTGMFLAACGALCIGAGIGWVTLSVPGNPPGAAATAVAD